MNTALRVVQVYARRQPHFLLMAVVQQVQHVFLDVMKVAGTLFSMPSCRGRTQLLQTHTHTHVDLQMRALSCQQILYSHNLTVCLI